MNLEEIKERVYETHSEPMEERISWDELLWLIEQVEQLQAEVERIAKQYVDMKAFADCTELKNAKLREALQFYACTTTYRDAETDALNADGEFFPYGLDDTPISQDLGGKARAVLEES